MIASVPDHARFDGAAPPDEAPVGSAVLMAVESALAGARAAVAVVAAGHHGALPVPAPDAAEVATLEQAHRSLRETLDQVGPS